MKCVRVLHSSPRTAFAQHLFVPKDKKVNEPKRMVHFAEHNDNGTDGSTPAYNMGVRDTPATYSFDWLALTWKDVPGVRDHLMALLGGDGLWLPIAGFYGYKRGVQRGAFRIYDEGNGTVFLELRGEGCRQLALEKRIVNESDWQDWFQTFADFGGRATRIDVAIDDHRGLVKIDTIVRKVLKDHLTTSFRTRETFTVLSRKTGKQQRSGVRFGGSQSDRKLLIYDKGFESGQGGNWLRIELQSRGNTARALALQFCEGGFERISADIHARLAFRVPPRGLRGCDKLLWNECSWWSRLVGQASREFRPLDQPKSEGLSECHLRGFRYLLLRAYEADGEQGLRQLWQMCSELADDDLHQAVTAFRPKSRGGKWYRQIRLFSARKAAEIVDAELFGLGP
jgi:hypothetical protein